MTRGPLARALALAIRPRRPYNGADSIGLAWHHMHVNGSDVIWHNGGTGGFRTFLGVDIARRRTAIALSNGGAVPIDGVGVALLQDAPLVDPPSVDPPVEIPLPASTIAKFVGSYEMTPQFIIQVTQVDSTLFLQATGQPKFQMFATSRTEFFLKAVRAELRFQANATGDVTGVILHQNGVEQFARKVR